MIPDYQSLMAPVLSSLADGHIRTTAEVRDIVAARLHLTVEDRATTIKSGSRVFDGRVHWALTYLSQAQLLHRPKRGAVQITERGAAILREHPDRVDNRILMTFTEFTDFQTRVRAKDDGVGSISAPPPLPAVALASPLETIQTAVDESNAAVADDLLKRILGQPPEFLERLVLKLLTAMGYGGASGSAERLGRSGDEGLDGVIRQDALGLDRIYVQAKRYAPDRVVGRPDIQGFVGALHGAQADRGVFITTSRFSSEAETYAEKVAARVVLIDGALLSEFMVKHNIGVQDREVFVLKRIDEDFFEEL